MAINKSAVKRTKQANASRLRNRSVRSGVLTARKKVLDAIGAGNKEEAQKLYSEYSSKLDKAAKKGVIPKNNANRKKSRVALSIAKMA
ncbi:MAG TPA: 30S ribosomal protein S20 [Candidatus Latescibacteria bacterium]|jgi:small subunit ribosomal protein S20|nr:30S ribosomal protein S20 [Kiritimatiellia bacterium]MDD2348527.1 30S ribosomal protein S20 [Kiritimatiellia bacterium]HON48869.1 30S ribosomal protein S20 [Kiritimatiellia bacterium]HOS65977.1 30S ribosomal protein S20 [Candidatus Latescibacterota bacterium]HRT30456.1 30S ribosomal protein S20 [Kiritimatiellia bacterium]